MNEKPKGAAERLAEETGQLESEFTADISDEDMPKLTELDWEPIETKESAFTDC